MARSSVGRTEASDDVSLKALVRKLCAARSIDEVMNVVTHTTRARLGADGVTFVLRDGNACYYADEDAISPLWKGQRFPMEACISGWCMTERKSAVIPDIYADDRIPQDAYRPTFVRSLAMVPVRQDDPIAAMGAYWATAKEIPDASVAQLQGFANVSAMAMSHVRLQHEADYKPLIGELKHRMRNIVTMHQAIVSTSLRDDLDRADKINQRITALAKSDGLLASSFEGPTDLRSALVSELDPFSSRYSLEGEDIELQHDRAQVLVLVVHELATNAVKHGAFASDEGHVSMTWTLTGERLELTWQEDGGPPVASTERRGFGFGFVRYLLEKVGGSLETTWRSGGIVHEMTIDLTRS
jgi:two-component sensor histidine kinase